MMKRDSRLTAALCVNALIVVFELIALAPTLAYALAAILLNLCRIIEGPYPFLMVYAQPWYASVMWCIVILGIAGLLASGVLVLHNRAVGGRNESKTR